jgi:hypothetical protein
MGLRVLHVVWAGMINDPIHGINMVRIDCELQKTQ